jgi:hypothetical protein
MALKSGEIIVRFASHETRSSICSGFVTNLTAKLDQDLIGAPNSSPRRIVRATFPISGAASEERVDSIRAVDLNETASATSERG